MSLLMQVLLLLVVTLPAGPQAHETMETSQDKSQHQMYLTLAEKMMDKYIADKRVDGEAGKYIDDCVCVCNDYLCV